MLRKKNASLIFIFITVVLDTMGLGIIIPIIPTLITKLTGQGLSDASLYGGWLLVSFSFFQFLFAPLLGTLSDRVGRRPVLLVAMFGLGVDYLIHAYAPTITWLFAGRILAGITGASYTVANAYVADISKPEDKAKNFGMVGAAFGLGFILGPVIGGFCSRWGVQAPFLISAGLSFLNFLYGLLILPESLPKEKRRKINWLKANPVAALSHLKKYPMVTGLVVAFFFVHFAGQSLPSVWVFFTELKFSWSEKEVGLSLGVVGLLVAIVQGGLTGVAVKKLGEGKTVFLGFLMWSSGMLLFMLANSSLMLYLVLIPYCLGGIAGPTLQSIISNQVPDDQQGELQGALTSVMSLSAIVGPPVMTGVFFFFTKDTSPVFAPGAPYGLAALLMLVGWVLASYYLPKLKKISPLKHKNTKSH